MENSTELIQQLRAANARIESVLEQMSDCFVAFDREWLYTQVNAAAESAFRMARDQLLGKSLWKLLPQAYDLPIGVNFRRSMEERKPLQFECFYPEPLNRWFECRCYPTEEGLATFFSDITDRKQTEEVLRESEERFRVAQELSPDGFLIFRPLRDDRGVVTDFLWIYENEAAARMNDTDPKQVCGKRASQVLPHHEKSPFHKICKEVVETGEVRVIEQASYDQDTFRQRRWFRVVVVPTAGGDVAIVVQNVTERKLAEEALRESHERLKKVLEVETLGVMFWDLTTGLMTDANDAFLKLMGYSRSQVEAGELTWQKLTPPEYVEVSLAEIRKFQTTGRIGPYEKEYLRNDGTRQWLLFAGSSLGGNACVEFCVDIADRKRAEEALRKSEQRERERAAELQTILDTAPIGLAIAEDTSGNHIRGNRANEEMYGLGPGAELSKASPQPAPFRVFQHGRELAATELPMQRAIRGEVVTEQFIQVVREDGHILTALAKAAPLLDEAGRPRGAVGAFLDVTKLKAAEEGLRESRAKYQALTETTSDFIWEMDAQGRYTYCSPQMERLWGLKPSDMIGRTPFELGPADQRDRDVEFFRTLAGSARPFNGHEATAYDSQGRLIHLEISGVPFFDNAGKLLGFRGITRDITERKRAEDALAAAHGQLQSIIDNTTSIVYALDLEERFVMANAALAELLNFTPEQMIGKRRHEFMPREDADWHEANDRQVIEAGHALEFEEYSFLKGSSITWLTTKFPLRDANGKIYAVAGISADISGRKRAEEQLRRSEDALRQGEERLRLALDAGCMATWDWNLLTGNVVWNEEHYRLLGYQPGEQPPSYQAWVDRVHPEDFPRVDAILRDSMQSGTDYFAEFRAVWPDSSLHYMEARGRFELDDSKKAVRGYGVMLDITERKKAEEKLRDSELHLREANANLERRVEERTAELAQRAAQLRALAGELTLTEQRERKRLANLLHDHLQQLLVAAKFRTAVLGRGLDDLSRQATKEVEDIIDESIAASRSLTGELSPPILHDAGLNAGLQWLARRMADKQGLFVDLELAEVGEVPDDLKVVLFDSVREMLFNIVKHARTSSASMNLRRVGDAIQLTLSDQGVGFDPSVMPAAIELGGGFGLFGIRERLELFGGTMKIESAPDQGCRIVLSAPIAKGVAVEQVSISALPEKMGGIQIPSPIPGEKIRVLLADDHKIVRQGIANLIGNEPDIEIIGEAGDGVEVVQLAGTLLPDVILMDMSMPKLNGVEATRVIHNEFPDIRIIGLSMYEEAERAQALRDAGASDYVTKSGPAEGLLIAIRKSVRKKQGPATTQKKAKALCAESGSKRHSETKIRGQQRQPKS